MPFLFEKIPRRIVRSTVHPHVFRLEIHPLSTLDYQGALASWLNFIQDVKRQFSFVLLWLNDLNKDVMAELGESVSVNEDAHFFVMDQEHASRYWLEKLDEGGWAMFFYVKPPAKISLPPESLPTEPEALLAVLNAAGAKVIITSWYDNNEWIIACTDDLIV